MNRAEWLEKNGFDVNSEKTFCVVGENTYSIKDALKAAGFKYMPTLGWHASNTDFAITEDFHYISFDFNELFTWDEVEKNACLKFEAKNKIKKAAASVLPPCRSQYIGEVGERIRNQTAVFKSIRGFEGKFGWTNVLEFKIGEDILTWFTSVDRFSDLEPGTVVNLTATVKKHEEFREKKTTVITRAIVKTIETDIEIGE